jgi:RNA polymerase sigma factor (sigma-70 family)
VSRQNQTQFEALYKAHVQDVYAYCMRRSSREEAKDMTSDVFLQAWRRFDDMPRDEGTLFWLYSVARNVVYNHDRSRRRRKRLYARAASMAETHVQGPEPQVVQNAEHEEVLRALSKLPKTDREIITLVEWEGVERQQVAEMLFLSKSAIDKRIKRAHRKLAVALNITPQDVLTTPVTAEEGGME